MDDATAQVSNLGSNGTDTTHPKGITKALGHVKLRGTQVVSGSSSLMERCVDT